MKSNVALYKIGKISSRTLKSLRIFKCSAFYLVCIFLFIVLSSRGVFCSELENAHFENINDHDVLIVDERPYILLGIFDQHGFSNWDTLHWEFNEKMLRYGQKDPFPPARQSIEAYEVYYSTAREMGFNTVLLTFLWQWFETANDEFVNGAEDIKNPLYWHMTMAEKYGMKIIIRWFGTNISSSSNYVPFYIQRNEDDSYQKVVKATGETGDGNNGIYCYNHENILAKEKRALKELMGWIGANDLKNTYIMIQLNNEIHLGGERCYCDLCNASLEEEDDIEGFNQRIMRDYVQESAKAVHEAEDMSDFITYLNVWPNTSASPDLYVEEWLIDCPDLTFIGPDIYHIGYKEGDPEKPFLFSSQWDWYDGDLYLSRYKTEADAARGLKRNIVMRTEAGCIVPQNEKPYRDIFDLLGLEHNAIGDCIFELTGGMTSNRFQGLLTEDFRWLREDLFHQSHRRGYFTRDSFIGIHSAASQIAQFQNTDNFLVFTSNFENGHDCSGDYVIGGTTVSIQDNKNYIGSIPAKARGMIIKKDEHDDYTFVGVDYSATVYADIGGWDLKAEGGFWFGDEWYPVLDRIVDLEVIGTEGFVVTLPMDNDETEKYDELQYCVRVYDGPQETPRILLPKVNLPSPLGYL